MPAAKTPVAPLVRVLAAGGTFDKCYDPIQGALGFGATSHLPALLERARAHAGAVVEVVMLVDSLEMTEADRQRLLDACRHAPQAAIVIVHGTDTLTETARVIGEAAVDKTIVLTGAMVPCTVEGSDALFNLGYAMACAQHLPRGCWVAMNATARPWNDVRKNRAAGVFESSAPGR